MQFSGVHAPRELGRGGVDQLAQLVDAIARQGGDATDPADNLALKGRVDEGFLQAAHACAPLRRVNRVEVRADLGPQALPLPVRCLLYIQGVAYREGCLRTPTATARSLPVRCLICLICLI